MERKDVMSKNVSIYKAQAAALEKHGSKDAKVGPGDGQTCLARLASPSAPLHCLPEAPRSIPRASAPSPRPSPQILVVANPANTNALILKEYAPSIPAENITAMTRLDHNRALGQVSSFWGFCWWGGGELEGISNPCCLAPAA